MPKPLKLQNHRRSRSVAHLVLPEPWTITGHVGVLVHSPGAPLATRSKSFAVASSNQAPLPLPPVPPPLPSKGDVASRRRDPGIVVPREHHARANSVQLAALPMPSVEFRNSKDGHFEDHRPVRHSNQGS